MAIVFHSLGMGWVDFAGSFLPPGCLADDTGARSPSAAVDAGVL